MNTIKLRLLLLINTFYVSDCVRRIQGGEQVFSKKTYMVYLVKSPNSNTPFDDWLCGGALVTTWFIITAQECVNDVEYMYAIAGYDTYVPDAEIQTNQCTRKKKKKVVYYCVPKQYEKNADIWSLIDIALVKVESPYDFEDQSYKTLCSYIPSAIPINYEPRFQEAGTDGFVLGWGHTDQWRQPNDTFNYNQKLLRYASVRIMDEEECLKHYTHNPSMELTIIAKYMICTLEKGELDEYGKVVLVNKPPPKVNGCGRGLRLMSYNDEPCDEGLISIEVLRSNTTDASNINQNDSNIETKNKTILNQTIGSRRTGICQNDHGGPLVTWMGAKEVLIGVASLFRVSNDSKCMGPYLYTSTRCNGAFLDCVLRDSSKKISRAICDTPPIQRGYDTVEKHISWRDHPDGAAENEIFVNEKKFRVSDLTPKPQLSQKLQGIIKLENETIAIRPQMPLKK